MAIVYCEDCYERICSDCEGNEIEGNKFVCPNCFEEREEVEGKKSGQEKASCGLCGAVTFDWILKNEGKRCQA